MSILAELTALVTGLGLPVETGVFSGKAPEEYVVLTPMVEDFALHCDNRPEYETQQQPAVGALPADGEPGRGVWAAAFALLQCAQPAL